jgi:hypothetical protein
MKLYVKSPSLSPPIPSCSGILLYGNLIKSQYEMLLKLGI